MSIEVNIYPDPLIVADAMYAAAAEIDGEEGPMFDSLDILMSSIERAFIEQGPGWEPWSESYAMSMGHGHGPRLGQDSILIRDGSLIGSTQDPDNYTISHDSIEWNGSSAPDYAEFHLTGTSKMPERNFLVVDEVAQEDILSVWASWLQDKMQTISNVTFRGGAFRDPLGRFARKP